MGMNNNECNGWKNEETWNVALWINNDEGLYSLAKTCRHQGYKAFAHCLSEMQDDCKSRSICTETPDGVAWSDEKLDVEALDEMLKEL